MAKFITTSPDVRTLRLGFAFLLMDGFTRTPQLLGKTTVCFSGKPNSKPFLPLHKSPGATFLFFDLPPGNYTVVIHDDKGPPGDSVYSVLETTAYIIFPPVWPFVFRSNKVEVTLRVLPGN